ncbi:hypothetical protein BU14_0025s0067 [Porphyra umbilicalis]|uniref:Uncharacterized protein n=1 Tax=Porphyra umbilicalis TaxID=2786 RepID=A0A1X6PK94_PORUM|nr:hypothetical protein BU14_0025s0067 [Porphyra umbilicalis]|eukprot:OSX81186.1 hypothetical protein BU14_0025s0067 [Porphyra umbilicalis]
MTVPIRLYDAEMPPPPPIGEGEGAAPPAPTATTAKTGSAGEEVGAVPPLAADAVLTAGLGSGMELVVDVGYIPLGKRDGGEAGAAIEAADAADAAAEAAAARGNRSGDGDADGGSTGAAVGGVQPVAPSWKETELLVGATAMSAKWKALALETMDAAEAAGGRLCHDRLAAAAFLDSPGTDSEVWVWRDAGRRQLVVAFRGTETVSWKDVMTDVMGWQVPWVPGGPIELWRA